MAETSIREEHQKLVARVKAAREELRNVETELEALQKRCPHRLVREYRRTGTVTHESVYGNRCVDCGKEL